MPDKPSTQSKPKDPPPGSTTETSAAPRKIIILLDGTNNQFGEHNTNLLKLMSVIRSDETQLVYYSSGIGTILPEGASTGSHLKQKTAQIIDMGLAVNFEEFVCNAYEFLMDYYRNGDNIYLFGFSRGSYTARALAGMIQRVGLLPAGNHNQVSLAYEMYTGAAAKTGAKDPCVLYRRIFGRSRPVFIKFMGVWDTVSSLGGIGLPTLPFASGSRSVKFFRQALALDERRARFIPEYWRHDPDPVETGLIGKVKDARSKLELHPTDEALQRALKDAEEELEEQFPTTDSEGGRVMKKAAECWFMGCHSDVGGGNTENDKPSLSNVTFRWMLREATRCGLLLDHEGFAAQSALVLPNPIPAADLHDSIPIPGSEALDAMIELRGLLQEQFRDARRESEQEDEIAVLRPKLPQAELAKMVEVAAALDSITQGGVPNKDVLADFTESLVGAWVTLELLLLRSRHYNSDGTRNEDDLAMHRGQPRQMWPSQKCHRSVLLRLMHDHNTGDDSYKGPAALVAKGSPEWSEVRRGQATTRGIWEDQ